MEPQNLKPTPTPTPTTNDLVTVKQKMATLDQLLANYNQLYKTYLQEVESEVNKKRQRKYPYNIKNPNEFGNTLPVPVPFPSNGTEDACFKSCMDSNDCMYALYSNSGCGVDCNPNKCLLYGKNADGIAPVAEAASSVPACPVSKTDAWCKAFNNPVANATIPVLVLRTGDSNWRTLLSQMPKNTADAADVPLTVDLTTSVQTWWPDSQFSDVNYAPGNQISLQFRYFAEYWLNAYSLQSGSTQVIAGQGPIGTFAFSKLNSSAPAASSASASATATAIPNTTQNMTSYRGRSGIFSMTLTGKSNGGAVWGTDTYTDDSDISKAAVHAGILQNGETKPVYIKVLPGQASYTSSNRNSILTSSYGNWDGSYTFVADNAGDGYVGTFGGKTMFWTSNQPPSGGAADGLQTAKLLADSAASAKFKYNYSAFEKPVWSVAPNTNAMLGQIPPQVAQISVPSWKFLGLQDSAAACQTAATNDPDHVFTSATYFNASYNNPKNGNGAFARACYGHVAGAPESTIAASTNDNNVQTMTPPYGYTKLGGKNGIIILKKMYQLNKQIMAITDDLNVSNNNNNNNMSKKATKTTTGTAPIKEAFTPSNERTTQLQTLSNSIKKDEINLNKMIKHIDNLDADEIQSNRLLLRSRIKLGVGIVLGLLLGYLAYRFLTSSSGELSQETQETIKPEVPPPLPLPAADMDMNDMPDLPNTTR
jgi:hypothetical protein